MKKIVAIGGGEIGRKGLPTETAAIDKEIVRLSGKKNPRLLFIPTASSDAETYVDAVIKQFGDRLGCRVDVLYLIKKKPDRKEIKQKILSSDIIYVGGGNTLRMMRLWRKLGVDLILRQAWEKGSVLSGISAGAICWFRYGSSDSRKQNNPAAGLIRVSGLGFIRGLYCPHYDSETDRRPHLKELMRKTPGKAIAVQDCSAIEILDDTYRLISSKKGAAAFRVYWKGTAFHEELIKKTAAFSPLRELL